MRTNSDDYNEYAQAKQRELRLVISMVYSGTTYYFTSHSDIGTPGASTVHSSLIKTNAKTQRYIPEQARSEIGRLTFSLLDVNEAVSDLLNDEQFNNDEGPRGRIVTLWRGFKDLPWADYRKEMTQQIDSSIDYQDGEYSFSCSDKLSSLKSDIFDFPSTRLSAEVAASDTSLSVYTTTDFDPVEQGTSYSYSPSSSLIMIRIKSDNAYEICSATGKTATEFTGVTRGLFGTVARAYALPDDANDDNGIEVEYYPYLELPVSKLIYALLTGVLLNQGGATLPAAYHRGIAEADINTSTFEDYPDWYDSSDETRGLILRFEGGALSKTDGKTFIEKECLQLINAYLHVDSAGKLSLRRKVTTLADSDYISTLDASLIAKHGKLTHDLDGVANKITVHWGYREFSSNDKGFNRTRTLTDPVSRVRFPNAKTRELSFKGLHPARHTTTILQGIFASLRDAVAAPPLYLSGVSIMPSIGFDIEVGDVHRVDLSTLRDYQSLSDVSVLDRPFEVRRVTIDQVKDSVVVDFVGSSTPGSVLADSDGGTTVVPDAKYTSAGTDLDSVLSINGSGFTTASGTLTGGTTTRTRYYYDGDLTISSGHVISFTGNIEIWVKGHFSVLGSLDGKGGGNGLAAALGTTLTQGSAVLASDLQTITFRPGITQVGAFQAIPTLMLENDAGDLSGIPADLRGTGGANGPLSIDRELDPSPPPVNIPGGLGGNGGGSVVVVSRGVSFGASGQLDVSGDDGGLGAVGDYVAGGSGAGGSAGGVLLLIDGSANSVPVVTGKILANRGNSPTPAGNVAERSAQRAFTHEGATVIWSGWLGHPSTSQFGSNVRVQYVPVSRTPYDDVLAGSEIVSGVTATAVEGGILYKWTNPSDPGAWDLVEIWINTSNTQTGFAKVYEGRSNEYFLKTDDVVERFAWFRTRAGSLFSAYLPATDTTTYSATPLAGPGGSSANWSEVVDDDGNKPADNADVTSANTSGDTALVNGVAAATVQSGAQQGSTASQASGVADNATATGLDNIIANGSAEFGNNALMSGLTYTTAEFQSGEGAFSAMGQSVALNDLLLPINTEATYEGSISVKASYPTDRVYVALELFDENQVYIPYASSWRYSGQDSTLYETALSGASTVKVVPQGGVTWTTSNCYIQLNIETDYSDLPNYQVYSVSAVDTSNPAYDLLTLSTNLIADALIGSKTGKTYSGGTYSYGIASNDLIYNTHWTEFSGIFKNVNAPTSAPTPNEFRIGTKFFRMRALPNYLIQAGSINYFDNIKFREMSPVLATVEPGADVTSANTAGDTAAVNGVAAATVQSGAQQGSTASQATNVADNADVTSANTAGDTALVNGVAAATVQSGAQQGSTASQATGVEDGATAGGQVSVNITDPSGNNYAAGNLENDLRRKTPPNLWPDPYGVIHFGQNTGTIPSAETAGQMFHSTGGRGAIIDDPTDGVVFKLDFSLGGGYVNIILSSEFGPVLNNGDKITISFDYKLVGGSGIKRAYFGGTFYDSDGNSLGTGLTFDIDNYEEELTGTTWQRMQSDTVTVANTDVRTSTLWLQVNPVVASGYALIGNIRATTISAYTQMQEVDANVASDEIGSYSNLTSSDTIITPNVPYPYVDYYDGNGGDGKGLFSSMLRPNLSGVGPFYPEAGTLKLWRSVDDGAFSVVHSMSIIFQNLYDYEYLTYTKWVDLAGDSKNEFYLTLSCSEANANAAYHVDVIDAGLMAFNNVNDFT